MGINLDTPLVKVLLVGSVAFAGIVAFTHAEGTQAPGLDYVGAASTLLAGRSDAQLNQVGDTLCEMFRDGRSVEYATQYLIRGGASEDSADQLPRIALAYKCPDALPRNS